MARKKLTANQKAYQSELRKLKQRIAYQIKKGFKVEKEKLIPETPDKIRKKDIEQLKNIRAKQIKEIAEPPETYTDDIPTFDYIHAVEELIDNLPDYVDGAYREKVHGRRNSRYYHYPLYEDKAYLLNLLWDTANEYDDLSQYNEYLSTVYSKIQSALNPDFLPSDLDVLEYQISIVASLITGRAMSMEEAIRSNSMQENL